MKTEQGSFTYNKYMAHQKHAKVVKLKDDGKKGFGMASYPMIIGARILQLYNTE